MPLGKSPQSKGKICPAGGAPLDCVLKGVCCAMTEIFISHSSKDNAWAERISTWLKEQGYEGIFLDFDPQKGIPAGRDW